MIRVKVNLKTLSSGLRYFILFSCGFALYPQHTFAQTAPATTLSPKELHVGIEVAPKIIRVIAVRISNGVDGYNVKVLYSESASPSTPFPKDGKLTPEYTRDLAATVQSLIDKTRKNFQAPPEQIYIIGLSELVAQNQDELANEVRTRTGKTMSFLTPDAEVQLSIAGIIPRRYRYDNKWYDNRVISTLVEIGNIDIKGGYQQLRQTASGRPDYDYSTWIIPKGAITFMGEVNKAAGEDADYRTFARRAEVIGNNSLRPVVKTEIVKRPGILNRKKVYLTGEIVWAMVTLLHPEDQRPYIPITMEDIDTFYMRAVADPESLLNPDLSKIKDDNLRLEIRKTREAVKQTFTPKALIAGAELIRTLSSELNLKDKTIIYARYSYLARILSYVRLQPE